MIHGNKDEVVPVIYSRKILRLFNKAKKKLIIIKNGDHSLSNKKNLYIVFLHGFMSDLEGDKPKAFYKFCKKIKLGFLGLEYSGHG